MTQDVNTPPSDPRSTGCQLMMAMFAGLIIGMFFGEPTLGFVIGFSIGLIYSLIFWLKDRKKSGR
jgi:uncharacterized membrane protein